MHNPLRAARKILFLLSFASNASRKIHAINNGKKTLYGSVSAKPPAVLLKKKGCIATISPAKNPPTLPLTLFAIKNAGITARDDIMIGT